MNTRKVTTLVLILFSLILGCSSDESVPELKTESFIVKPFSFQALSIAQTEGDILEVYGTISARIIFNDGLIKEERILWQRDRGSFINVPREEVLIDSDDNDLLFNLTEDEIYSKVAEIEIVFSIWDYDPDGNDDFIGETLSVIRFKNFIERTDKFSKVSKVLKNRNGTLIVWYTIEQIIE